MPKSKTRKGRGSGNTYAKGHEQGIRCAIVALLADLPDSALESEEAEPICPACALDREGFPVLAELARDVFHVERRSGHTLRAVSAHA
jgi:hypothetical protein